MAEPDTSACKTELIKGAMPELGTADKETDKVAAPTLTVTSSKAFPPGPVHSNLNNVDEVRLPVDSPTALLVALAPDQLGEPFMAVHDVALVDDQVNVEGVLKETLAGVAIKLTVGTGVPTVTGTLASTAEPPLSAITLAV